MISRRLPLSVAKAAVPQCHSLISLIIATMRACYHRSNPSTSANSAHHETEKISTPKERGDNK